MRPEPEIRSRDYMHRILHGALFLMAFCLLPTAHVGAAEINVVGQSANKLQYGFTESLQIVQLTGPIRNGDLETLRSVIDDHPSVVSLDSNGGSYREGIRIASFLREHRIPTVVMAGNVCLSACAIAFLGGSTPGDEESTFRARSLAAGAKLGFHAPFLEVSRGSFEKQAIEAAYDRAVATIVDFVQLATTVGVDPGVAADLMRPQREHFRFIDTVDNLGVVGIAIQSTADLPHLTRSMALHYCANGFAWARNASALSAASRAIEIVEKMRWHFPVFNSDSDYMSEDKEARRTLVPTADGGEGAYLWCLVEFVPGEAAAEISCRGYIFAYDADEALQLAKSFDSSDPTGVGKPDSECSIPIVVDGLEGYEQAFSNNAWAFVPATTKLEHVNMVLRNYSTVEEPLR